MRRIVFLGSTVLLLIGAVRNVRADSPIVLDSAGHAVGYLTSSSYCSSSTNVAVYTAQSYFACLIGSTGKVATGISPPGSQEILWPDFVTIDCTGQPLAATSATGFVVAVPSIGLLAADIADAAQLRSIGSMLLAPSNCQKSAPSFRTDTVQLKTARSLATGINPSAYVPPFSVRVLPDDVLGDVIFFDQFEQSY